MLEEGGNHHIPISELLPPAWDRLYRKSDRLFALRISLHTCDGLIPSNQLQSLDKLECELRVTLFDITYKHFFGKTWVSPKMEIKTAKDSKIQLNKSVYFHTSFADQSIALAVEVIISQPVDKNVTSGWTFLRIFQTEGEVSDINSGSPAHHKKLDVYHGSPRALLFLEEPIESNRFLQKIMGCQLRYQMMTHAEMLKVLHLIPENVLIGGNEVIPGLIKDKNCDTLNVKIDKGNVVNLEKVVLSCENIEKFEDELCQLMNDDRLNRENMTPDGSELTVIERRLQIGVHNGWSYVQEPQIHHLIHDTVTSSGNRNVFKPEHRRSSSIVSKCSNSSTLVLRNKVTLTEVPENCFVVFLLEYVLSFPMPTFDRRPSSSASLGRGATIAVSVCWGSWAAPTQGNPSEISLALIGGPSYNADSLLLYRRRKNNDLESMRINFQVSIGSKTTSPVNDAHLSLIGSDEEGGSLGDNISSLKPKRPSSGVLNSQRKASSPKSPPRQHFISSPSKPPPVTKQEEQLPEVSYAPSPHLPIMPVIAGRTTSSAPKALSRAGYALIYSTAFPTILDRHGKSPEVVEFRERAQINFDKELSDHLKCNEIFIELLALSGSELLSRGQQVYFSFQFYRFPPVVTESLFLDDMSCKLETAASRPFILHKANEDGTKKENCDPGYQIRYDVDTQFLHDDAEHKIFLKHLSSRHIFIDVLDASSLLLIGSTSVPLNCLCRKGKSAIQVISEFDVINNEYFGSAPPNQAGNCQLHIRLANVGRPMNPEIMKEKLHKSSQAKDRQLIKRFQPLIEEDKQLLFLINSYSTKKTPPEMSEVRKRKLGRMDALRARKGIANDVTDIQYEGHLNKLEILTIVDEYRRKNKDEIIQRVLCQSVCTDYSIFPNLGNVEVVLHSLVNHSAHPETIGIESSSSHFSVITDCKEWLHFKDVFGFNENVEEDMFSVTNQDIALYLRPKEKVIIPFKYQQIFLNENIPHHDNDCLESMVTEGTRLKVTMTGSTSKQLFSVMNVDVHPQPIICHQLLKFQHSENSFFKTFLQIPSHVRGQLSVQCSDKDVICGIENSDVGGKRQIHVKAPSEVAGVSKTIYIFLYADRYSSSVVFSWKLAIQFLQKVDICCTEGQTCRTSLILRGHSTTRSLHCFSSDQKQMAVEPSQSFILPAGALQEIHLGIRVMESGVRFMQVNVTDEERRQLFKSWLVCIRCERQSISKAFQVNLPVGSAKSAKKRVKFTNPYFVKKTFTVQTNRPDLLQIKESVFELDSNASHSLGLYFLPCQKKMTTEVLVFINNSNDENEETFCVRAVFS